MFKIRSQILPINNQFTQNTSLLIRINVNETSGTGHVCLFTYWNPLLITCGFRFNIEYLLFIYSKWCQQQQCKSPLLFIYANSLLITCPFRFNNHDLFVYLFKVMSTTASQITTCFYLLMQITCWLHVLFVLIFSIYLFIYSKWCKQMQRKSPPVFIYLWKLVVDYMWFLFEYSVFICLFIQSNVNNSRWKWPPVFIYLCKWFVVKDGFRFNIYYLFFYLFKAMSTKAGGTDHLFLFTYGNLLFIYCGFRFNIHYLFIYLFIQGDVNKKIWERPPAFIYLCKWVVDCIWFSF